MLFVSFALCLHDKIVNMLRMK